MKAPERWGWRWWLLSYLLVLSSQAIGQKIFQGHDGYLKITSEAPLELIRATSRVLKGILSPEENTFAFSVEIKSLDGFNSELQRTHFNENYMESQKFPTASFSGKIIESMDWSKEGNFTVRAKGKLRIHGVEQERIISAEAEVLNNQVNIRSSFVVALADHSIDIPKVVTQKISEEIVVEVDIALLK